MSDKPLHRHTIDEGGEAFPQHGWTKNSETESRMQGKQGMTLRDYFAAKAIEPILLNTALNTGYSLADAAKESYQIADAMLAERNKEAE